MAEREKDVYGINIEFGPLCTTKISKSKPKHYKSIYCKAIAQALDSHIANEFAKLMLVLKAHSLAFGCSGIAEATLDRKVCI